jgi:NAD(P)-dependent dehydrogenase (short-subunit alcohol dehydrogenase family)
MSIILITGSSTGIGYAIAETLGRNGHAVYATMRNPQRSPQLQQLADTDHLPIKILPMDVTVDQSVQSSIGLVLSKEGRIDVLINNAGIHSWGSVEELPLEVFKSEMDTNYFGVLRCIKEVLPSMRDRKQAAFLTCPPLPAKFFPTSMAPIAPQKPPWKHLVKHWPRKWLLLISG